MSLKVSIKNLEIRFGDNILDYEGYAEENDLPKEPFLEISFIDEEEGKIGFYPGVIEENGVLIDRTTANSMKRILTFLANKKDSHVTASFAMRSATISIDTQSLGAERITLSLDVPDQFFWKADMTNEEANLVAEAIQYALDQYEASTIGEEAEETAKQAGQLLAEMSKKQHGLNSYGPARKMPQAIPIDDWGSEP